VITDGFPISATSHREHWVTSVRKRHCGTYGGMSCQSWLRRRINPVREHNLNTLNFATVQECVLALHKLTGQKSGMDQVFGFRSTQASGAFLVRAGAFCAVVCLFFGSTLAIIMDAPFQYRMQTLLLAGLLPAIGFYAGGRASFYVAIIGAERRRKYITGAVRHAYAYASRTLAKIAVLGLKAYCAALFVYPYVRRSIIEVSCLMIRSAARLLLRIQAGLDRRGRTRCDELETRADLTLQSMREWDSGMQKCWS
jgi:hypothetical protein